MKLPSLPTLLIFFRPGQDPESLTPPREYTRYHRDRARARPGCGLFWLDGSSPYRDRHTHTSSHTSPLPIIPISLFNNTQFSQSKLYYIVAKSSPSQIPHFHITITNKFSPGKLQKPAMRLRTCAARSWRKARSRGATSFCRIHRICLLFFVAQENFAHIFQLSLTLFLLRIRSSH